MAIQTDVTDKNSDSTGLRDGKVVRKIDILVDELTYPKRVGF